MKYDLQQTVHARIAGDLSFADTSGWNKMIDEMLSYDCEDYTLDLTLLTRIDSSGIGLMMVFRDRIEKAERSVVVIMPKDPQVVSILQLANLEALFTLKDSQQD